MPKISVIIPVFNAQDSIEQCALSIFNQTFSAIEIIFVNDGSTDHSEAILKKLSTEDNRVIVVDQKNKGTGEARNTGIMKAQGDFICFLDSDDTLEPQMLSQLYAEVSEDVDIVVCDFNEISESGKVRKHSYSGPQDFDGYFKAVLSFDSASSVWAKLFRTTLFDNKSCLFPVNLRNNEDNATLFKLLYFARNIRFVLKPLYNWKRVSGSKSRTIDDLRLRETIEVLGQRKIFLQSHGLFDNNLAAFYSGVIYTLSLRKAHIEKFSALDQQVRFLQTLHTAVMQNKLIAKAELSRFREINVFDYWRLVFFSLDKLSKPSSIYYAGVFEPNDWAYALQCSQSQFQPEIYSLGLHLQNFSGQPVYVYGVGETWGELKKLLPASTDIKGYIDRTFNGCESTNQYNLNCALELMCNNAVIVVASVSQVKNICLYIANNKLYQVKRPKVITYAGILAA